MQYFYIYLTKNLVNGKFYVGKRISRTSPEKDYYLGSGTILKRAILKYGKENFQKEILEFCTNQNLEEREVFWIKTTKANKIGYNITEGGTGGRGKGFKHSEETKNKIKLKAIGRKRPLGVTSKIQNTKAVKYKDRYETKTYHFEEFKKQLSIRVSGENNPSKRVEVREKISKANKGVNRQTKESIKQNIETRRKNGTIFKSEEARKKIKNNVRLTKNLYLCCCLNCKTKYDSRTEHHHTESK